MSRTISRSLVVAVGTAVASTAVVAGATAATVPSKIVTAQGLRVSLPGGKRQTTVDGGTKLVVSVRPKGAHRGARPTAKVTVTRAASGDEKAATVARKSLRKGSVRFRVAEGDGVKYRVQVQIGKRRWSTRLVTADEATPAPPSTGPCAPSGTITADVATVAAGGTIPFHITNTGNAVLTYGSGNGWARFDGGSWSNVPGAFGGGAATTYTIAPGQTRAGTGEVWSTLTPGIYSLSLVATCASPGKNGSISFKAIPLQTTPITVTAAAR